MVPTKLMRFIFINVISRLYKNDCLGIPFTRLVDGLLKIICVALDVGLARPGRVAARTAAKHAAISQLSLLTELNLCVQGARAGRDTSGQIDPG